MKSRILLSTTAAMAFSAGLVAQAPVMRTFDYDDTQPQQATVEPAFVTPDAGETQAASRGLVFASLEYNYGRVKEGTVVKGSFEFTNTSMIPVRVTEIRSSCGCTATKADERRVYEPGESGEINAEFNTRGFNGRQIKTVTIVTDEPPNGQTYITRVAGMVVRDVYLSDMMVNFGNILREEGASHTLDVFNMSDKPDVLQSVVSRDKNIQVSVGDTVPYTDPATGQSGTRTPVTLTVPPNMAASNLSTNVRVQVDYEPVPEFAVNVRGRIVGAVQVDPEQTFYGILYPEDSSERTHTLTMTNGGVFELSDWSVKPAGEESPAWDADLLQLDVAVQRPSEPGQSQFVRMSATAPSATGRYDGTVMLMGTANNEEVTVEVPFRMFVRSRPAGTSMVE